MMFRRVCKSLSLLALILLVYVAAANSQTRRGINAREHRQQQRIFNGVRSGELTGRETFRLEREQFQIRRMEARFRASGDGLSNHERFRLERELNQSSRHIYRQKHDEQDSPRP